MKFRISPSFYFVQTVLNDVKSCMSSGGLPVKA
nr:MAG TPA: hypothetical protein [Caudoviricetes sp.]DAN47863.1 MAG TPA: hypothetical protein [Caudoviricetes sp.]DAQ73476.1 MAG TPA: hypothetical protein [Caudoviricetes sp.]